MSCNHTGTYSWLRLSPCFQQISFISFCSSLSIRNYRFSERHNVTVLVLLECSGRESLTKERSRRTLGVHRASLGASQERSSFFLGGQQELIVGSRSIFRSCWNPGGSFPGIMRSALPTHQELAKFLDNRSSKYCSFWSLALRVRCNLQTAFKLCVSAIGSYPPSVIALLFHYDCKDLSPCMSVATAAMQK